jgi:hypothetical protein
VIPHIDVFLDDGETKEEWKMVAETKKILDPKIKVTATCVRVPVFVGHSEAINIEFEDFLDWEEAQDILREAPGVMVIDKREPGGWSEPFGAQDLAIGDADHADMAFDHGEGGLEQGVQPFGADQADHGDHARAADLAFARPAARGPIRPAPAAR